MACDTSCRDCVFAVIEGRTQTGCQLGRLDKYARKGVEIVTAYDVDEDALKALLVERSREVGIEVPEDADEETKEKLREEIFQKHEELGSIIPPPLADGRIFSMVKGRLCVACRHTNSEWAQTHPPEQWLEQIDKDTRIRLHVLIIFKEQHTLPELLRTLESLARQKVPPAGIHVLLRTNKYRSYELINHARKLGPPANIQVRVFFGSSLDDGGCIDTEVQSWAPRDCNFYAVFPPGSWVPEDFVSCLNKAVTEDLEQFLYLKPNARGEGLVVLTNIHRNVGGNRRASHEEEDGTVIRADTVQEKIDLLVRDDHAEHLVRNVEELCPSLAYTI